MYIYYVSPVKFTSPFRIPELNQLKSYYKFKCQISIEENDSDICISSFGEDSVTLYYDGFGSCCITHENIVFKITPKFTSELIGEVLSGEVLVFYLGLKKVLTFHAGCVQHSNHKAIAFLGDSGAGKSTAVSLLLGQGYKIITDDVCPVLDQEHVLKVYPNNSKLSLYRESFDESSSVLSYLKTRETIENKAIYKTGFTANSVSELHCVFILKKGTFWNINPLKGVDAFQTLFTHLSIANWSRLLGLDLLEQMNLHSVLFKACIDLCRRIKVYELERPSDGFDQKELVRLVNEVVVS